MPGWEFKEPEAFREASREELRKSGLTKFVDSAVENVQKTSDGLFEIIDNKGDRWLGRKLLLATGMKDVYPDLEGYLDCYSKGMLVSSISF